MNKTHHERAVEKIKAEISKDINKTVLLTKVSGYGELFYYLHYLHSIRLIKTFNDIPESEQKITEVYVNQLTDAYKYIIQLLLKNSQKKFVSKDNNSKILPCLYMLAKDFFFGPDALLNLLRNVFLTRVSFFTYRFM